MLNLLLFQVNTRRKTSNRTKSRGLGVQSWKCRTYESFITTVRVWSYTRSKPTTNPFFFRSVSQQWPPNHYYFISALDCSIRRPTQLFINKTWICCQQWSTTPTTAKVYKTIEFGSSLSWRINGSIAFPKHRWNISSSSGFITWAPSWKYFSPFKWQINSKGTSRARTKCHPSVSKTRSIYNGCTLHAKIPHGMFTMFVGFNEHQLIRANKTFCIIYNFYFWFLATFIDSKSRNKSRRGRKSTSYHGRKSSNSSIFEINTGSKYFCISGRYEKVIDTYI